MNYKVEADSFLNDLDRVSKARHQVASCLSMMAVTLIRAESEGECSSGGLSLDREIEDLNAASNNLKCGVFRLIVLGDMKRGKSTFLNALLGENLLPSDVNPCTALITVLRFGAQKKVTVYFNNGKSPEELDIKAFKHQYTIDPTEAHREHPTLADTLILAECIGRLKPPT